MSLRTKWESLVVELISCSSLCLAEQLASGVAELNWTEFKEPTCVALLRWIYTNKVVFSSTTDVTAEQWHDLLLASYKLELVSLCTVCERKLTKLLDDGSLRRLGRFRQLYGISKKVGANQLMQKCLELGINVYEFGSEEAEEKCLSLEEPKAKIAKLTVDSDCAGSERCSDNFVYEQMAYAYRKFALGYNEFQKFSDMNVKFWDNHVWRAHAHVLGNRSKKIVAKLKAAEAEGNHYGIMFDFFRCLHLFIRWIYTDCIVFEDSLDGLLKAAYSYELPALFDRCENALVEQVDIRSCGDYHQMAVEQNALKLLKRCNQVIAKYFNKVQTSGCSPMDYEHKFDDSLNQMLVSESPIEAVEGLLTLNDDCLLHTFRFVSMTDLGSIKDTCKRLSSLADQSFRLRKDKSLEINSRTMFSDVWILKHFGKFIKSLRVKSFYDRYASLDDVLELIAQCTGDDLKSIYICDLDDEESDNFECLKTVLETVECIKLQWFQYDTNVNLLLGFCKNLKEVRIDGEETALSSDWCARNPNVTKWTLRGLADDSILEEICNELPHLESLSMECIVTDTNKIFHLGRLSHLKKLTVGSLMIGEALEQFADKNVLEDLTLFYLQLTESLSNVLGEFANLSNLIFDSCFDITSKAIVKVIGNLSGLKELSIIACKELHAIDRVDYLSLGKMRSIQISLDPKVYKRSCELIGNSMSSYVQLKQHPYVQLIHPHQQ